MTPSAATRLLGVVGWPIGHSLSPILHNAALAALGLDFVYLAFAVPPARLAAAVDGARALGVRGLNVTLPHKETALALCEPDALAARVGAVNTLVFDEDAVRGTNTDVHGFRQLMAEAGVGPTPHVLVLGAGGAARAVVAAVADDERAVTVVARTPRPPLVVGGASYPVAPWSSLPQLLPRADLLVDATPRGLDAGAPPLDLTALRSDATVLDLAARRTTALVESARARGLRAAAGAAMLLHQGAAALERWTGRPATAEVIEVMRRALDNALA